MNRESNLPPFPFVMNISITARGKTDNGAGIVSNETRYTFEFTQEVPTTLAVFPATASLAPGARQTFIVTGGTPPYQIFTGGGSVDTTTVVNSGDSFTYTADNTVGTSRFL